MQRIRIDSDGVQRHNPVTVLINSPMMRRSTETQIKNVTNKDNERYFYNEFGKTTASYSKMYISKHEDVVIIQKSVYYDGNGSEEV